MDELRLNANKTNMLLLSRKRRAHDLDRVEVMLEDVKLQRSEKVKYLGVRINDRLTWRDHIKQVRNKCFAGLAKLRRLRDVLPTRSKVQINNAIALPYVEYCSVLWQECTKELQQSVERIQNYEMHIILTKPPRTPSDELRQAL